MPSDEITDMEWAFIQPQLPTKVRGVKRRDDRQVLSGIFHVLRAGCPWSDMPECYGPYMTAYNRFTRWSRAGVWDRIMDAVVDAHNGDVVMIDGTSVRVHHSGATLKKTTPDGVWDAQEAV